MSFDKKDQQDCWNYTYDKHRLLMEQIEDDFKVYLGDQFKDGEKAKLAKKGKPALSINVVKKPVDLVSGFQRQNWQDLTALPIEGADEMQADVYSQLLKWIFSSQNGSHFVSSAFDDAVICGLGWVTPEMNYERDLLYGDIRIMRESPMSILVDPAMNNADLSDAMYILRHAWMSKQRAKALFPEFKELIDKVGAGVSRGEMNTPSDTRHMVRILENWKKEYEMKKVAVNLLTGDVTDIGPDTVLEGQENYKILDIPRPTMKLVTTINEQEVIFDGDSPYGLDKFPFIPLFGYFIPSFPEWEWRVQGLVRILKDSQREKNKRRSQIMEAVLSMPHGGWMVEKGAVDDYGVLRKAGSTSKVVEYNPGKSAPRQIESPPISGPLMELEQLHSNDIKEIGLNPDLLGMVSDKGAPAALGAMRQKQGITAIQTIFDNFSMAKKNMGRYVIDLISANWDSTKVSRIIGSPVPFDLEGSGGYYDIAVDEIADSPTFRMANFAVVMQMVQQGYPIPPQLVIELAPVSPAIKEKILRGIQPPAPDSGETEQSTAAPGATAPMPDITQGQPPQGAF